MKKLIMFIALMLIFSLSGCGMEASENGPAESDDASLENNLNIGTETDGLDIVESKTENSESEQQYEDLEIVGIHFEIPGGWSVYNDGDDKYFGYYIYPVSNDGDTPYYFSLSYISLEDAKDIDSSYSAILSVANGVKNIEGCEDYESDILSVCGFTSLSYKCVLTKSECTEIGCLVPVYDMGIVSMFYEYEDGYDNLYGADFEHLIQSVAVPDEEKIAEAVSERKSEYEGNAASQSASDSDKNGSGEASTGYAATEKSNADTPAVDDSAHHYYTGVSESGAKAADAVAKQIADSIVGNPEYSTDLQKVTAAASAVAAYCNQDTYGMDTTKYYRSPYGVFVAGVYTCAGSTRALGRVLDYMGYSWQHSHENENRHQWCVLTMDGQTGFADGMAGIAGYGVMTNGMTLPDGSQIHFAE